MLKWDSKLQQKELVLQMVQQELEERRQHTEGAKVTLRSEQDAF